MLRKMEEGDARKVFDSLIGEEKHHLEMLGRLLEERVLLHQDS
jgi:rubrerythrin